MISDTGEGLLAWCGLRDLHTSPRRIPTRTELRIIKVGLLRRWGPARIAGLLRLNPATVHRVLVRYRLNRLAWPGPTAPPGA